MSDLGELPTEKIQFDEAEFADEIHAGPVCGMCRRPIAEEYYEVNQVLICGPCRKAVDDSRKSGSGFGRFLRASLYGFGAAIAGFAIYFGILKATGYEIGLISILVGVMVGKAVRAGSGNRGGWLYQLLAMFFVYTAIVASHSSLLLPELFARGAREHKAKEQAAKQAGNAGAPAVMVAAEKPVPPTRQAFFKALGQLALLLVMLLGFLYALPVLMGLQAPIGLLIIAFALWEAWKINRKVSIIFNGPFRVGDEETEPSSGVPRYA